MILVSQYKKIKTEMAFDKKLFSMKAEAPKTEINPKNKLIIKIYPAYVQKICEIIFDTLFISPFQFNNLGINKLPMHKAICRKPASCSSNLINELNVLFFFV
jgi:hypothetical protein